MSAGITERELMRVLSVIVAKFQRGTPMTARDIAIHFRIANDSSLRRRAMLEDRGLITLQRDFRGAFRLHPTAKALELELPPPEIEDDDRPARKTRRCMGCPTVFVSDGAHHRHCDGCRRRMRDAASSPWDAGF